jgi:hypothetical protein
MQTDRLFLAIKTPDTTYSIASVSDQGSALQPQAARATVGFAFSTFGRLQPMKLATMQPGWDHIPQASTGWFLRPTDACCKNPAINGM